jgi:hypothetical protein
MSEDSTSQQARRPDLARIKTECSAMLKLLKNLEKEEHSLRMQNEILAREALLCGFEPHLLEPPVPKRRKTSLKKQSIGANETTIESTE